LQSPPAEEGTAMIGRTSAAASWAIVILLGSAGCTPPDEAAGAAVASDDEPLPEGGKLDGFDEAIGSLLENDALGRVDYASCPEVAARDVDAVLAQYGTTRAEAEERMERDVRFAAFRKVATLSAVLQFVSLSGTYRPLGLPSAYTTLPDFARYYDFVQYLNLNLDLQRDLLRLAYGASEFGATGDTLEEFWASIERRRAELADERRRAATLEDDGARSVRLAEIDAQELALLEMLATVDPSRADRQRLYQGSLEAAALEVQVIVALTSLLAAAPRGWDPWSFDDPAVWRNDLGGAPLDAPARLRQLYARYPILATDDSLLRDHDLAERIYDLVSPDFSAADRAAEIAGVSGRWQVGWDPYVVDEEALRGFLDDVLYPEIDALRASDFDLAVQELIDRAADDWSAAVRRELEELPGIDAAALLEYADLVDSAIAAAPEALQLAYQDRWCRAESRARWISGAKTAVYLGLGAVSIGALLLGQVEIAVPVGWLATALLVGDAVHANLREAELYDAHRMLYIPYDRYTAAERERLFLTAMAAVSVAAEAAQAARLLDGWQRLQAMKARLRTVAGEADAWATEFDEARSAWLLAVDAGTDTTEETARLARAAAGYQDADAVARIARRTLAFIDESEAMRGGLGRIAMADLVERLGGEADAVTFFERVSRSYPRWSREARAGYRAWIRDLGTSGTPDPVCR
jgi:hypothetical protein